MKRHLFLMAVLLVFAAGCTSVVDELSPADITLGELEKRMAKATDPEGIFRKSRSYVMRQEVKEKQWLDDDIEKMVEVKFSKPDKFALITYEDNSPVSMFCTDGTNGWVADCLSRKVMPLDPAGLERMKNISRLGTPGGGGYLSVFKKVELNRCINEQGTFFRIDCYGKNMKDPIYFYVDSDDYLLRRVKMKVAVKDGAAFDYESVIRKYEWRNGVLIPMEMEIRQLGAVQVSKVIFYELDRNIPESDFMPPVL